MCYCCLKKAAYNLIAALDGALGSKALSAKPFLEALKQALETIIWAGKGPSTKFREQVL
jgi:hypothetical protein